MGVAIGRSYAQQQTLYKKFLVKVVTVKKNRNTKYMCAAKI